MVFRVARWIRWVLVIAVAVFAGLQFVNRPNFANPPLNPAHSLVHRAPPDVRAILDRSCRDCHTHETRWPLYSRIAPMSWLVAGHVRHGRDRVNFSEWTSYDGDDQDKFLGGMCSQTKRGRMPLPSYLWLHREATLSQSDVAAICAWTEKMRDTLQ